MIVSKDRRFTLGVLALMLAAAAGADVRAAESTSPANLPLAQILDRNAAARGGTTAWRAVRSIAMKGELDAGGKVDTRLPFVSTLARPSKSRIEIRFADQTALQVWDGAQGWKVRPFLNRNEVEPYTPAEAKSAVAWDELDGPLIDHARKGIKVELIGIEPVEAKRAYKLLLTTKDGRQRNLWLDAASFLEVKVDGEPRRLDGRPHGVAVYYRNYKAVDGLMVAHELETEVQGVKQRHKMTIQGVKLNPALDASTFDKPSLALIKSLP
jgi:hypothetical protein